MRTWWMAALAIAVSTAAVMPTESEAKRLGGGGSQGMQRSLPARSTPDSTPAKPAAPTQASPAPNSAGVPAAAPKRSWMGPIAGLAAGLGLAALMSHFGLGEGLANFMMIALLALVAVVAIRFLMRRFGGGSRRPDGGLALAGHGAASAAQPSPSQQAWHSTSAASEPVLKSGFGAAQSSGFAQPGAAVAAGFGAPTMRSAVPADFDVAAFQRIAKLIFIRLQAANDAGNLDDLRNFTTPEMFAAVRLDLQERGTPQQETDVVRVDAEVLDVAEEGERQIASVRFHGQIREEKGAVPADFDEVWHFTKPRHGEGNWAIAGIQQTA